jgi:hypothetical protein
LQTICFFAAIELLLVISQKPVANLAKRVRVS